jgi:hypothetical protein
MSNQESNRTTVEVTCVAYPPTLPPIACQITIYTATGARHPVMATIEEKLPSGWVDRGEHLVNNWVVAALPLVGGGFKFTFDCPSPAQYWEIHIETPKFSPFPDYLDSMIGSCENRSFTIVYPGIITREDPRLRSEAEVFANYVSKPATAGGGSATA